MPPAIIAVAIATAAAGAAAAGYIALTTALIITVAATAAGALLTKTKVPSIGAYASQAERKQVLRSSTAPEVTIYGRNVMSGMMFFAEEQSGQQEKGEWLHMAFAVCGHEIQGISNIWLGEELAETYGENVQYEVHNNRQTPDPFMLANCQSWKDDMIGRGICWVRLSLKFDQEKFPAGLPNVLFEVMGKKVYDPRTNRIAWSDNAALCILDYYKTHCDVPDTDLNLNQFIQGANICDEITENHGIGRKRYTINGAFDATDAQSAVLDDLHMACAGEPTYMAGQHGLFVGAYYGPATMEIHEGQIISDVKIIPEASYSEKLNIVTGTFLDPGQKFAETDFPPVQIDSYVEEDGAEFVDDMKLRFVANEYQAQQLAQIKLNKTRVGRSLTFTMNMSGYQYRPGYYIKLFLPSLGINGQEFRINQWSMNAQNGVDITLRQEFAGIWDDAIGNPIERPDITDFPKSEVAQPINLLFTLVEIGQVVQGILSWTNIGQVAYNIVTIRQNGRVILSIQVPGSSTPLTGLLRGSYEAAVVAVSALGAHSAEAFTLLEIHAPDKPVSVEIGQGFFSITLKPKLNQITNVSTQFDFWTSGETRLNSAATDVVTKDATRAGIGQMWTSENLLNEHTYYWYVRSINAFGVSEFLEVAALVTSDIGELIDYVNEVIQDSDAFKNIQEPNKLNLEGILHDALAAKANVDSQWAVNGEISASVYKITTTVAELDKAFAQYQVIVSTELDGLSSTVSQTQKSVTDLEGTFGEFQTQVQSDLTELKDTVYDEFGQKITDLTATVATKMTSEITNDGQAKASFSLNLGVRRNGQYYGGGMGMSVEPSGGTYKVTTVFKSDNFGIYSGGDPGAFKLAFGVYNGQVFIQDAMIRDASITNAKIANASIDRGKITNYLQSDNFIPNVQGMALNFADGTVQINGNVPGQGRLALVNARIISYDENGNISAVMGQRV